MPGPVNIPGFAPKQVLGMRKQVSVIESQLRTRNQINDGTKLSLMKLTVWSTTMVDVPEYSHFEKRLRTKVKPVLSQHTVLQIGIGNNITC